MNNLTFKERATIESAVKLGCLTPEEALQLKQQNAELVAKIDRMQTFIKLSARKWEGVSEVEPTFWNLLRVANETPAQCLLEVKADAVIELIDNCCEVEAWDAFELKAKNAIFVEDVKQYANKIRRGEL